MKNLKVIFTILAMVFAVEYLFAEAPGQVAPVPSPAIQAPALQKVLPQKKAEKVEKKKASIEIGVAQAQAQDVVASPVPQASPSPGAKAVEDIKKVVEKIPSSLPSWVLALLAVLAELAMRIWPTAKPRSIFILGGQIFNLVGSGFMKISSLLDLIAQNLKEKEPEA